MLSAFPDLRHNLSYHYRPDFGWVIADNNMLHFVNDPAHFYAALGYGPGQSEVGILPEEYLWERYHGPRSAFSAHCLKVQLIVYLYTHSSIFRNQYGGKYETLIGKCVSENIDDSDEHCFNCPMHPRILGQAQGPSVRLHENEQVRED